MRRPYDFVRSRPDQRGFQIIELMIITAIMMLIVVAGFSVFDGSKLSGDLVQDVGDTDENVRASMTFMTRDFVAAGADITLGGVPVPAAFLSSRILYPITPGNAQGAIVNGITTDTVMLIYNQITLQGLDTNQADVNYVINGANAIDPYGSYVSFNITAPNPNTTLLRNGDILLIKANIGGGTLSALGYVTSISGTTVSFATGDPLYLNATGATSPLGSLSCRNQGQPAGCIDSGVAFNVSLVKYYLDASGPSPVLMRRFNGKSPTQLGVNIENLQITYTLNDGTTAANPVSPETIRKASIFLLGRSVGKLTQDQSYYRFPMSSDVATRNLAYLENAK